MALDDGDTFSEDYSPGDESPVKAKKAKKATAAQLQKTLTQKDAQINDLMAEIERLKTALGGRDARVASVASAVATAPVKAPKLMDEAKAQAKAATIKSRMENRLEKEVKYFKGMAVNSKAYAISTYQANVPAQVRSPLYMASLLHLFIREARSFLLRDCCAAHLHMCAARQARAV